MQFQAKTPKEYLDSLAEDRKTAIEGLRKVFKKNLPMGFNEVMQYGMISYVVPHSIYPAGYHCSPELPLPFISIASQKSFIAIHPMGLYGNAGLLKWFTAEFAKQSKLKLDMGKGCVRFKKSESIPLRLIGKLATMIFPKEWIGFYEKAWKKNMPTWLT